MKRSDVYFTPITSELTTGQMSEMAASVLSRFVEREKISLNLEIPLKVHSGEPGNVTFLKPALFNEIIDFLENKRIKTFFTETNTASGPRSTQKSHEAIAKEHGFTRIPFVIGDGQTGFGHRKIAITNGKHFKTCMIAKLLDKYEQIIVLTHFKGHVMSGFGGAIKMLGIGFASGRGKVDVHSKIELPDHETIQWDKVSHRDEYGKMIWNPGFLYYGKDFNERMAEYALAACQGKKHIYISYATDITENCDCDSRHMTPLYSDLGIFISQDPLALDKAVYDMLNKRENRKTFGGDNIFAYAEKIGLGSTNYSLIQL